MSGSEEEEEQRSSHELKISGWTEKFKDLERRQMDLGRKEEGLEIRALPWAAGSSSLEEEEDKDNFLSFSRQKAAQKERSDSWKKIRRKLNIVSIYQYIVIFTSDEQFLTINSNLQQCTLQWTASRWLTNSLLKTYIEVLLYYY